MISEWSARLPNRPRELKLTKRRKILKIEKILAKKGILIKIRGGSCIIQLCIHANPKTRINFLTKSKISLSKLEFLSVCS